LLTPKSAPTTAADENTPSSAAHHASDIERTQLYEGRESNLLDDGLSANSAATAGPLGWGLTWDQADLAVSEYQLKHLPRLPFVAINSDLGARGLLSKYPCLLRAILVVASRLPYSAQLAAKKQAMTYISQRLLVDEDRNLDILQGLLVLISWYEIF
jgi:hypothetical protein